MPIVADLSDASVLLPWPSQSFDVLHGPSCCGQSRIDPCAGNPLTRASTMQIVAKNGVASKWYGSLQHRHLGQYRIGTNIPSQKANRKANGVMGSRKHPYASASFSTVSFDNDVVKRWKAAHLASTNRPNTEPPAVSPSGQCRQSPLTQSPLNPIGNAKCP